MNKEKVSYCSEPWKNIFLRNSGRIQPCCMNSTYLGNINEDSLDDLWNGKKLQDIRQLILDGKYQEAGCKDTCPVAYRIGLGTQIDIVPEKLKESLLNDNDTFKDNISKYKYAVENNLTNIENTSFTFDIQPVEACNMGCIMCHQDHNSKQSVDVSELSKLFKYKENIHSIRFQGGEIFIDQNFTDYLIELKNELNDTQYVSVITNGSCLTDSELNKLTNGSNPVEFIISMDATEQKIFKYIRQSSQFKKVKASIEYLAKIQKTKIKDFLTWNYIVMKSNFYDVKSAIILASQLDVKITFRAILGAYTDENIFDYQDLREKDYVMYINESILLAKDLNAKVVGLDILLSKLSND